MQLMRPLIFTLFFIAFLAACGSKDQGPPALPQSVGEWTLGNVSSDTAAKDPTWIVTYQGSQPITVRLTRMSNTTLAFSAVQNWQPESGKLAFFHGLYLGMAESPRADQRTLNRFVVAFEKTLPN